MPPKTPLILTILDGWGIGEQTDSNAVFMAATPNMDRWSTTCPRTTLVAHNGMVGLPEGQMGNSEVGHLNIGAGRIVYQDFTRINLAVASGELASNHILTDFLGNLNQSGGALHLCGLLSDGGVHSHIDHLLALLRIAGEQGLQKIFVHCFMDGRDTPPASGADYMRRLLDAMAATGFGRVATVCGRYFAMDRDNRWERVERAWQAMVHGRGETATDALAAVEQSYQRKENDEFIQPTVILDDSGQAVASIADGDGVLFFNFRADRARELTRAFTMEGFSAFATGKRPRLTGFVTMTVYDREFDLPALFPPQSMERILGQVISEQGLHQLRIAETEKYAHVTYFFNGGREEPFPGEDRILIDSPRDVATYDLKPAMSAREVTNRLLAELKAQAAAGTPYDLIILNFANGDMVGHTGIMAAAMTACETVDACLGAIEAYMREIGGAMLITADHGNAEQMRDPATGQPWTAHTLNPVPLILVGDQYGGCRLRDGGALKDIAPTILDLLGIAKPEEMEGQSLLIG